ncbi:hypothetical protein DV738_g5226, partial [Chaetothyriales sp. CBS 135597]
MKVSPFIQKLQAAPAESYSPPTPPAVGWYFVYGTLKDPALLAEILSLSQTPPLPLYPAKLTGYSLKLWGQYPALVDGYPGQEVQGMAVRIDEQRHADRLAEYETKAYRCAPCLIRFVGEDGSDIDKQVKGSVFKYAGNLDDLADGQFDLDHWLRLMGRKKE